MIYSIKEQKDGIVLIEKDDDVVARIKVNDRWRIVNYSVNKKGIVIRLFDRYKKYQDVTITTGEKDIQHIP